MQTKTVEVGVGLFVAFGLAALLMLAMKVSNLAEISGGDSYAVRAHFDNIGGLKVRSPVKMAGVRVGKVTGINLDKKTYEAVVTMHIGSRFDNIPTDTSASIFTSGLLGEQYVSLEPGGEEKYLKENGEIRLTQSAVVLEQVIGQFLFNKAGETK